MRSFVVLIYTHKACVANPLPAILYYTARCHIFKIMEITQSFILGGGGGEKRTGPQFAIWNFNTHVIKFYCRYDF
jgi:hypothetical protein